MQTRSRNLILGGTGKTGRRVAERLLARELPVRIVRRSTEPRFDWNDADVAVLALTDDVHAGKTYELTGPRLLTFADVAREISEASARAMRYVRVSSEQYAELLAPYLPGEQVTFYVELFGYLLDGHNAHLADGVERALGRKPRDFRDYARAAAGAWSQ